MTTAEMAETTTGIGLRLYTRPTVVICDGNIAVRKLFKDIY